MENESKYTNYFSKYPKYVSKQEIVTKILDQLLQLSLPDIPKNLSTNDKEKIRFGISRLEDKIYLYKKELGSYDLDYLKKPLND